MYKKILIGTDTISGIAPQILDAISAVSNTKTLPFHAKRRQQQQPLRRQLEEQE